MSRTVIATVVAAVIVALTVVAFFVTSTSIDDKVRKDADSRLARAFQVADQLNQLRAIDIQNKAENLAGDPSFVQALRQGNDMYARDGFTKFTAGLKAEDPKPDMI